MIIPGEPDYLELLEMLLYVILEFIIFYHFSFSLSSVFHHHRTILCGHQHCQQHPLSTAVCVDNCLIPEVHRITSVPSTHLSFTYISNWEVKLRS